MGREADILASFNVDELLRKLCWTKRSIEIQTNVTWLCFGGTKNNRENFQIPEFSRESHLFVPSTNSKHLRIFLGTPPPIIHLCG